MSTKKTAMAVMTVCLLAGSAMAEAQSSRTRAQTTYTIPATGLRVNRAPRAIYRLGGATVYQFSRSQTGFTWPNANYQTYYSYPYGAYPWYQRPAPYTNYYFGP